MDKQNYTFVLQGLINIFNTQFEKIIDSDTGINNFDDNVRNTIYEIIFEIDNLIKTWNYAEDEIKVSLNNIKDIFGNVLRKLIVSANIDKIKNEGSGNFIKTINLGSVLNKIISLFFTQDNISETRIRFNDNIQKEITAKYQAYETEAGLYPGDTDVLFLDYCSFNIDYVNEYLNLYCVKKENVELFQIIISLYILTSQNKFIKELNSKSNIDENDDLKSMNSITLLSSYFEPVLQKYKTDIRGYIETTQKNTTINVTVKETITDIYEYILMVINTSLFPLDLNLKLEETTDFEIFKNPNFFENYLIEHLKIYNPSPCENIFGYNYSDMSKGKTNATIIYDKMKEIKHKQKYTIYHFSNNNEMYYYSIFYEINTLIFLNPSDPKKLKLLDNFDLHQCLIMNSTFDGNDAYKCGKFLHILNKIVFPVPEIQKSKIICFVNNSKIIVDELFGLLNELELFETNASPTPASPTGASVTQNIKIESYQCKYLKYDDISFYIKENEDDNHINLIVEKFTDHPRPTP